MGPVWLGVAAIVLFFGWLGGITAAQAGGPSPDDLLWAVALYTMPLTLGFGLIAFLAVRLAHWFEDEKYTVNIGFILVPALILWICGELSRLSGLGVAPEYGPHGVFSGSGVIWLRVFKAYFNTYGWPLVICALTIGIAAAVQIDRWLKE